MNRFNIDNRLLVHLEYDHYISTWTWKSFQAIISRSELGLEDMSLNPVIFYDPMRDISRFWAEAHAPPPDEPDKEESTGTCSKKKSPKKKKIIRVKYESQNADTIR